MVYRTLIEYYLHLPTTVLTYSDRIVYRIQASSRSPDHAEALRRACQEINVRKLHRGHRLMVFEVVDAPARKA